MPDPIESAKKAPGGIWAFVKEHVGLILAGVASAGIAYYLFTRPSSGSGAQTISYPGGSLGGGGGGSSGGGAAAAPPPSSPTSPLDWLTNSFAQLIAAPPSSGVPSYATHAAENELLNYLNGRVTTVSQDAFNLWQWLVQNGGPPPGGFIPPTVTPGTSTPPTNPIAALLDGTAVAAMQAQFAARFGDLYHATINLVGGQPTYMIPGGNATYKVGDVFNEWLSELNSRLDSSHQLSTNAGLNLWNTFVGTGGFAGANADQIAQYISQNYDFLMGLSRPGQIVIKTATGDQVYPVASLFGASSATSAQAMPSTQLTNLVRGR